MPDDNTPAHGEHTIVGIQSLIVAFVLAMTFRGFVTEGFVIPTGSMAPTLLGQHVLLHSPQTGYDFQVGVDPQPPLPPIDGVPDPMLGPLYPRSGVDRSEAIRQRMGDRILVIKCLYPFSEPERYDVVVFKNPTDPDGPAANYIKRLVGLPNEKVWLLDGDVFAAPNVDGTELDDYRIQRKPEHVQRAVWQPVYDSDYVPQQLEMLFPPWKGPPWGGARWNTDGRTYTCETADPTLLRWDNSVRALDDWTIYNELSPRDRRLYPIADLRIAAGVEAASPQDLEMTLQLAARQHLYEFRIAGGAAEVRMRPVAGEGWVGSGPQPIDMPDAGDVFTVEFWHADQAMHLFINGEEVVSYAYDWTGGERLRHFARVDDWPNLDKLPGRMPASTELQWTFSGSPLQLHRVRVDRDLYYHPADLNGRAMANYAATSEFEPLVAHGSYGFGTHPEKPAALGPDHFFMLGDNSQASLDSRLWGNPHPIMAEQVDPAPFVVHRQLIIGKAWVVYFPAPYYPVVPDMGRLRFIR